MRSEVLNASWRARPVWAVLALAAMCLGACGSATALDKEGTNAPSAPITLVMQTPDAPLPGPTYFAEQVSQRTHGQLTVVVVPGYNSCYPTNEMLLVKALVQGQAQMGYLPSRAWERVGQKVLSFRALQAPFLVNNYALLRAVVSGPVAEQMLTSLSADGLVGLGLVPMELRRPLGVHPLVSLADFRGARVRVIPSATSMQDLQALDAVPSPNWNCQQVGPALSAGQLQGIESSTLDIGNNSYNQQAKYLSGNVVLFAKTETITITKKTFDHLSPEDRAALVDAAAATVAEADPASEEQAERAQLCGAGLQIVDATPSQLSAMERATAPVYRELERDPATKKAILEIEALKAHDRGDVATLPSCNKAPAIGIPALTQAFPTGVYESVLSAAEMVKAGYAPQDAHTERLTFKNGRWLDQWIGRCIPYQPGVAPLAAAGHGDCAPGSGTYTVKGDLIAFGPAAINFVFRWSYFRGQLTLQPDNRTAQINSFPFDAQPWTKVK